VGQINVCLLAAFVAAHQQQDQALSGLGVVEAPPLARQRIRAAALE